MITETIIHIFQKIILAVLSILPSASSVPSQINSAFTLFAGFFQKANAIFPMDTVFTIIGITISVEAAILAFKLGDWLYNKIRGTG